MIVRSQRGRGLAALNKQTGRDAIGAGVALAPVIAGAVSSSATVASATGLGPMLAAVGISGPLAPFVAGAIVVALPVFRLIKSLTSGCGETCLATSKWADTAEAALKDLHAKYFAQPVRTVASQGYALQVVEEMFRQLRELCSNPATGAAGQRCISERLVRGGTAPWCPSGVGCDWYALYYDPIANDSGVVADSVLDDSIFGSGAGAGSGSRLLVPLLLLGGAGLVAVMGSD